MTRRTHLVGAWPGRAPEHAMQVALEKLAPHLDRMSDGETGDRSLWVTVAGDALRANPDVEMVHDGEWTGYDDIASFRVREGGLLDPENVRLVYARAFEGSYPSFKVLRERYGRPDLRFQVGIPSPVDLGISFFEDGEVFGPGNVLEPLTAAHVREIERIHSIAGEDVLFQIETTVGLVAVAQAADDEQPSVAAQMAGTFKELVRRSPAGTRFGIHLCLGDFQHKAYAKMRDVRPIVLLANEFAAADEPPIRDQSFYAPLADLDLPAETQFFAGFIHESLDLEEHAEILVLIENLVGREVGISQACGLGRRPSDDQAWEAMEQAAALIERAER